MIWHHGEWTIVDCRPDQSEGCDGSTHELIQSTKSTDGSCPYDDIAPWKYCVGELFPGDGCTEYDNDATAAFTCV
jgi:hypothetical protein